LPCENVRAFFIHLCVDRGKHGSEVLPVIWQDNYFELMPGEEREINYSYSKKELEGATPYVAVDGWNIESGSCQQWWSKRTSKAG
jgi:exo-1,4-beta-D-glucosaminidase